MERDWRVDRPHVRSIRYVVMRLEWADAFGSAYKFARIDGKVARFFRKESAQRLADKLNSERAP